MTTDSVPSTTSLSRAVEDMSIAPCDVIARGSAGVPTDRDEPLLVVRYASYWTGYASLFAPGLVVYRSGAVAVARTGGNDGSDVRSGDGTPSPFRSFLGGRFSPCAVDRLVAEFDVLARIDLGDAHVYDCTEATIQKFDQGSVTPSSQIYLNGFGCEGKVSYASEQQREQRAARDRLVDWVERASKLQGGRGLPMDRIILVDSGGAYPDPARNTELIDWTEQAPEHQQSCRQLSGDAATTALSLVAATIAANPGVRHATFVYTAAWRVAGQQRRFSVMLVPPAATCELGR